MCVSVAESLHTAPWLFAPLLLLSSLSSQHVGKNYPELLTSFLKKIKHIVFDEADRLLRPLRKSLGSTAQVSRLGGSRLLIDERY